MGKQSKLETKPLKQWQLEILEDYIKNESSKLRNVVYSLNPSKYGVEQKDIDNLISNSSIVLWQILYKYDKESGISFKNYLKSCLAKKFITWAIRDPNRSKRKNRIKLKDKDGNDVLDKDGKPVYETIPDVSIDTPIGEDNSGGTIGDTIEDNVNKDKEYNSERVENYLDTLSSVQKDIANLIINKFSHAEIRETLNISEEKYAKILSGMNTFDQKIILKAEKEVVEEDKPMEITTFEKSKTNRLSITSIIKKINSQTIRFNHSLQRPSDQWTTVMKGNLVSDILQGNPINPLIFAEEIINGVPIIWDLDGKQRCTNAYDYSKDVFKVSKKVGRPNITYTSILKDENGKQILDENGFPQSEVKQFNIINKKFSQLPEELQEKFLDYNFEIVQYINCSKEDIAYHIERYNSGKPMSVCHKGIIKLGEEFATMVKSISVMPFFKEQGGYTVSEAKGTNGTINRVVVESVMAAQYLNDWKKTQEEQCEFLKENATTETFENFEDMVDRLSKVGTDEVLQMFTSKDSFLYFGLYARFIDTGLEDGKFIEFMAELNQSLHSKKIDGVSFDALCDGKSTKDKYVVVPKMELLTKLMMDYLHIDIEETQSESVDTLTFIRENVSDDSTEEDVNFYQDMLEDLTLNVDNNSKLLDKENMPSLLAVIAYSCRNDIDLDDWLVDYFAHNTTYIKNQKQNYITMVNGLNKYISNTENNTITYIKGGQVVCAMQN